MTVALILVWWGEALWVERLETSGPHKKDNEGCPHWWWALGCLWFDLKLICLWFGLALIGFALVRLRFALCCLGLVWVGFVLVWGSLG